MSKKRLKLLIPILILISIIGGSLIAICIYKNGPGITNDSVTYISGANNLINSNGYSNSITKWSSANNKVPIKYWPPLYSIIIGSLLFLGIDQIAALSIINILSFCLVVFFSGLIIYQKTQSFKLTFASSFFIATSFPLIEIYCYAYSEVTFILFLIISIFLFNSFLKTKSPALLLLAGLFSSFTAITRLNGLILILTFVIVFIISKLRRKIKLIIIYLSLAFSPFIMWTVRNMLLGTSPAGDRSNFIPFSLSESIKLSTGDIIAWIIPFQLLSKETQLGLKSLSLYIVIGLVLFLILALIFIIDRKVLKSYADKNKTLLIYVSLGSILTLILLYYFSGDYFDFRHLIPMYIPLVILFVALSQDFYHSIKNERKRKLYKFTLISLFVIILIISAFRFQYLANAFTKGKTGTNNRDYFRSSEAINWLTENKQEGTIYSNNPYVVHFYIKSNVKNFPKRDESLEEYIEGLNEGDCIIWFRNFGMNKSVFDIKTIKERIDLEEIISSKKGDVYLVERDSKEESTEH